MAVEWFEREELMEAARARIHPASTVLDIGCGIRPQSFIEPRLQILCDPHQEYVAILNHRFRDRPDTIILQSTALSLLKNLPDRCVDTIFLIDVIEHLPKHDGLLVVAECQRVAHEQVVLFTPLGFMPQEYAADDPDAWGYSGGEWQLHQSGWTPDDFDASWEICACKHFHLINGKGEPFDPPFGAFWAVYNVRAAIAAPDDLLAGLTRLNGLMAYLVSEVRNHTDSLNSEIEGDIRSLEQIINTMQGQNNALQERVVYLETLYQQLLSQSRSQQDRLDSLENQRK